MADPVNVHITYEKTTKHYHQVVAQRAIAHTPAGGRIIDIGCGVGHLLQEIGELGRDFDLHGADAFERCVQLTKQRVPSVQTHLIPESPFDVSAIEGAFDTAILCHVLEHLNDPVDAVRQVVELVKPGGAVVLAVPNLVTPVNFLRAGIGAMGVNKGHVTAWDPAHWKNFIENIAELDVIEYAHDEVWLFPRHWSVDGVPKRFERFVSRLAPGWSFSNIAVVRVPDDESSSGRVGATAAAPVGLHALGD